MLPRVGVVVASAVAMIAVAPLVALALEVQVVVVHAADSGPTDPGLVSLRPRLRRLVSYRSFRVVQDETRRCAWRDEEEFPLPGGHTLQVVPRGVGPSTVLMKVRLLDGRRRLVDTDVRLRYGGMVFLGMGRDIPGGKGMIIVLRAGHER